MAGKIAACQGWRQGSGRRDRHACGKKQKNTRLKRGQLGHWMDTAIFIVLGWLLGLLSPRVVDKITQAYRRKAIKRTLSQELRDLRARLAMTACIIAIRAEKVNRKLLQWTKPIITDYTGFYADPELNAVLDRLSGLKDEELAATCRALGKSGKGFTLKKFAAPFLTAHLLSLNLFSPKFEQTALEIASQLDLLNGEIDAAWFLFTKTFDPSLPNEMLETVIGNINHSYEFIGRACRDIADNIGKLLDKKN